MRYLIFFIILCLGSALYFLLPPKPKPEPVVFDKSKFVSIKNGKFSLNNTLYYPISINYIVGLRTDKHELWPCSDKEYNRNPKFKFTSKDSCLIQLKADMQLIKEMGFNSVRIVGIGAEKIDDKQTGELSTGAYMNNNQDTTIQLIYEENYPKYLKALDELLAIVNEAGLKAVLLTRVSIDVKSTEEHLKKLANHLKNDTTILAYDLFNEPLYFDEIERDKKTVYKNVKRWRKILNTYAPNQLVTIGLTGIREVFEWDPNILDVDFISLHPYEYEPEQVRNEIYWYGKYIKKPWIIGETAIPADNDSVSYEEQKQFAAKTIRQSYNCGAIGYSWWQYKDVEWGNFHANFMGVLNWKGETETQKPTMTIEGTIKPLVEEFKKFNPTAPTNPCVCLSNYYNYSQHKTSRIIGRVMDEQNEPVEGGVILAWNEYWSRSYHTVTKADGSFELLGDFPFYHWMASASLYTMVRGEISPDTANTGTDKIPTINLGDLYLDRLTFID